MAEMKEFLIMGAAATGLVTLGIVSVVGIAVLQGLKDANNTTTTLANGTIVSGPGLGFANATVTLFQTGIGIFGTFSTVIALVLVGKIILGLLRQ